MWFGLFQTHAGAPYPWYSDAKNCFKESRRESRGMIVTGLAPESNAQTRFVADNRSSVRV